MSTRQPWIYLYQIVFIFFWFCVRRAYLSSGLVPVFYLSVSFCNWQKKGSHYNHLQAFCSRFMLHRLYFVTMLYLFFYVFSHLLLPFVGVLYHCKNLSMYNLRMVITYSNSFDALYIKICNITKKKLKFNRAASTHDAPPIPVFSHPSRYLQ